MQSKGILFYRLKYITFCDLVKIRTAIKYHALEKGRRMSRKVKRDSRIRRLQVLNGYNKDTYVCIQCESVLIKSEAKAYLIKKKQCKQCHSKANNEFVSKKRKESDIHKLTYTIRMCVSASIRNQGYTKRSKTNKILGCDFETFKKHIERQFTKGMTWDNYGRGGWHLDHIYPVSLAIDEKHLLELNHYTNFQPMWENENIKKSNKIIEHQIKIPL
jgi:phage FluMu protein Com